MGQWFSAIYHWFFMFFYSFFMAHPAVARESQLPHYSSYKSQSWLLFTNTSLPTGFTFSLSLLSMRLPPQPAFSSYTIQFANIGTYSVHVCEMIFDFLTFFLFVTFVRSLSISSYLESIKKCSCNRA